MIENDRLTSKEHSRLHGSSIEQTRVVEQSLRDPFQLLPSFSCVSPIIASPVSASGSASEREREREVRERTIVLFFSIGASPSKTNTGLIPQCNNFMILLYVPSVPRSVKSQGQGSRDERREERELTDVIPLESFSRFTIPDSHLKLIQPNTDIHC